MIRGGEKIRNTQLYSVFLIVAFLLGLLISKNNLSIKPENHRESISLELSILKSSGAVLSGIQSIPDQIYHISNKDNFELLSVEKIAFLENNKTDQQILLLEKIQYQSAPSHPIFLKSLPLPHESEEIPVLS